MLLLFLLLVFSVVVEAESFVHFLPEKQTSVKYPNENIKSVRGCSFDQYK